MAVTVSRVEDARSVVGWPSCSTRNSNGNQVSANGGELDLDSERGLLHRRRQERERDVVGGRRPAWRLHGAGQLLGQLRRAGDELHREGQQRRRQPDVHGHPDRFRQWERPRPRHGGRFLRAEGRFGPVVRRPVDLSVWTIEVIWRGLRGIDETFGNRFRSGQPHQDCGATGGEAA